MADDKCCVGDGDEENIYVDCIRKQLEEVDMLTSIYCTQGEFQVLDPCVISDFNEFLKNPLKNQPQSQLEYTLNLMRIGKINSTEKLEVRFGLPHLYPALEYPNIVIHKPVLSRVQEQQFKMEVQNLNKEYSTGEAYVFQLLSWLQDNIERLLQFSPIIESENPSPSTAVSNAGYSTDLADFERLWIYSHHIKSKTKRQEIIRQARDLALSGFSRPGKPGIICVEGLSMNAQEFWRVIKAMRWQKISVCKSEKRPKVAEDKINELRRFEGFKEQLFCADEMHEDAVMDMGAFIKFLEAHKSAYMKKELFNIQ